MQIMNNRFNGRCYLAVQVAADPDVHGSVRAVLGVPSVTIVRGQEFLQFVVGFAGGPLVCKHTYQ